MELENTVVKSVVEKVYVSMTEKEDTVSFAHLHVHVRIAIQSWLKSHTVSILTVSAVIASLTQMLIFPGNSS